MESVKVSISEAAAMLQVSEWAIRQMLKRGDIPAGRSGNRWVIMRAALEHFRDGTYQQRVPTEVDVEAVIRKVRMVELTNRIVRDTEELAHLEQQESDCRYRFGRRL